MIALAIFFIPVALDFITADAGSALSDVFFIFYSGKLLVRMVYHRIVFTSLFVWH